MRDFIGDQETLWDCRSLSTVVISGGEQSESNCRRPLLDCVDQEKELLVQHTLDCLA